MVVSLNTSLALNSSTGIARGNSQKGSARFSAPVCDSVSFQGSEAKSPLKSFFKKATMIGAFVTAGLGFTSCDPTNGPDVPDIKPPVVTVDPDAGLNPLQKTFKHTFAPVVALDTTEVGAISQVKVNDGMTGQDVEFIVDEAKSSADTLVVKSIVSTDDYVEGTAIEKFFVGKDGILTSNSYNLEGKLGIVRKYTKIGNAVIEDLVNPKGGFKYVPDKVGQSIKFSQTNLEKGDIVKLISKTMKKL